jgi:hypothetical protein
VLGSTAATVNNEILQNVLGRTAAVDNIHAACGIIMNIHDNSSDKQIRYLISNKQHSLNCRYPKLVYF